MSSKVNAPLDSPYLARWHWTWTLLCPHGWLLSPIATPPASLWCHILEVFGRWRYSNSLWTSWGKGPFIHFKKGCCLHRNSLVESTTTPKDELELFHFSFHDSAHPSWGPQKRGSQGSRLSVRDKDKSEAVELPRLRSYFKWRSHFKIWQVCFQVGGKECNEECEIWAKNFVALKSFQTTTGPCLPTTTCGRMSIVYK